MELGTYCKQTVMCICIVPVLFPLPRIPHSLPNGKQGTLVFTAGDAPSARKNKQGELEVVGVVCLLTHCVSRCMCVCTVVDTWVMQLDSLAPSRCTVHKQYTCHHASCVMYMLIHVNGESTPILPVHLASISESQHGSCPRLGTS